MEMLSTAARPHATTGSPDVKVNWKVQLYRWSVPVSSQETQTWRTDFVAEHQELKPRLPPVAQRHSATNRNQAGNRLVNDPPLLDLCTLIGPFQSQQDALIVLV